MFVTMATDSARNLVCWAMGSGITAMWCQFGPLGVFLSPPACISLSFVSISASGPLHFLSVGNGRCCVPERGRWRQCPALPTPNLPSLLLTVLGPEVPGWTGKPHCTDTQEVGLRWTRAWPGFDRLFGMDPFCLPSRRPRGKDGPGFWQTRVREM